MRRIPEKLRQEILADSYYKTCAREEDGGCEGRITWEHVWIYAGIQINEKWAIIPLCWRHHLGNMLMKTKNQWISLNRATPEDLEKYPRMAWDQKLNYLNSIYGEYN
ncbi:MAG: hypothetical protein IH946_10165 [Bacteroidetes bacterium]|nr:hypothetical protein [Bacteroidota bacterium]